MAVMIEPRKEDEVDPVAAEVAGLGNRIGTLEVKVDGLGSRVSVVEVKLDGLSTKVDEGFKHVDKRFEGVEGELLEQRREMKAGFEKMDERFERMQRHLLTAAVAIVVALIGAPHL